tara:strand:+ start:1431 stop:1874 length:444 start_codon:yes stop_codon:yes gene_type:complete
LNKENLVKHLPYQPPFMFVDKITYVSKEEIEGHYTFKKDEYFYLGHFKDNPITPGVILTEVMAQIGLVCLGIYLFNDELKKPQIALTSNQIDFFLSVKPEEQVRVVSKKIYFRFNKLKCKVQMFNNNDELVSRGTISGMLKPINIEK